MTSLNGDYHPFISGSTDGAGNAPEIHTSTMRTLTYAASYQLKWIQGESQWITLTGNLAVTVPDDAATGAKLTIYFLQDGTGGRTVTWTGLTYGDWSNTGNAANGLSSITIQKLASGTWAQVGKQVYYTPGNCSDGTATPADCLTAPNGSVIISAAATAVVVNTTAVTANSQIIIQEDSSLGTKLGVTCNTTIARTYAVTARTAGTSFTITTSAAPVTNPACLSYSIVN